MKLYIVRHGESVSNAEGYIAYYHTELTDRGKREAWKLGRRLVRESVKFDAVYCSPLYRALQTLDEIIKAGIKVNPKNIYITDLVREINRREFEGKPREKYYEAREKSGVNPDDFRCKGGESENDVKERATKFKDLLEKNSFKNVLLISHGHFIAQFTSLFKLKDLGHNEGASLCLLELNNNQCKIILWNDKRHIFAK